MIDNELVDVLFRSRTTLLDHLEDSGYDTQPWRKFSYKEIDAMVPKPPAGMPPALRMALTRRPDAPQEGAQQCWVYFSLTRIKQKLAGTVEKILEPDEGSAFPSLDPATTELIVMVMEPVAQNFHALAFDMWAKRQLRIRFFQAEAVINNPLKHVLVPKHEKVPKEEVEALLKELCAKPSQLPIIRFHEDPIARMLGLLPQDIVKITRPSPTAGECIVYRVCLP